MKPVRKIRSDDSGATLIIVLIIITALAIVIGVVMDQADTSVRATVGLRDETSSVYGADGAAQYAINKLRTDTTGLCLTSATNFSVSNFYPAGNGNNTAPASAYVTCTPDSANGTGGNANGENTSPGSAILTLATVASGEDGINVDSNAPGNNNTVKVRGGIFSNSTITVPAGTLSNTWTPPPTNPNGRTYIVARGACTPTASVVIATPADGTKTCNIGSAGDVRGLDPGTLTPHGASYNAPSASTAAGTISTCQPSDKYQAVTPGLFTSVAALNAMTGCQRGIVWFSPGVYYFDFQDIGQAHLWNIQNTFDVAGTPSSPTVLTSNPSTATWANACVTPDPTGQSTVTNQGAEFVFGGDSAVELTHQGNPGGQLTICASNTSAATGGGPPIAVYGLKQAVGPVHAESGCVISAAPATKCPLIHTDNSPNTTLTFQGTTYTPNAWIDLNLNNSTNQVFRWGLITRSISITATGSPNLSQNLIDVPDTALIPIPQPTISYLYVYECPNSTTCNGSGTPSLQLKIRLSPAAPKSVTILSWSQR